MKRSYGFLDMYPSRLNLGLGFRVEWRAQRRSCWRAATKAGAATTANWPTVRWAQVLEPAGSSSSCKTEQRVNRGRKCRILR